MKKCLLIVSHIVFFFALICLCACLWTLYKLNKELSILLGGMAMALIMTSYNKVLVKYYLDKKDIK
jgi:hypothetical protein